MELAEEHICLDLMHIEVDCPYRTGGRGGDGKGACGRARSAAANRRARPGFGEFRERFGSVSEEAQAYGMGPARPQRGAVLGFPAFVCAMPTHQTRIGSSGDCDTRTGLGTGLTKEVSPA